MSEQAMVCSNIGRAGKRKRTRGGLIVLAVGVGLFAVLAATHASFYARLWVGLPIALAAMILGQVTRSTCVALASKGLAENDDGAIHKVAEEQDQALRRVARGIILRAAAIGVVAAGLAALTALA